VTDVPAALGAPRQTYRIALMRACDLRIGDVVRRLPGERPEWHGDAWRIVSGYHDAIVGPERAVWDFDVGPDERLWEVQVPEVPPMIWWTPT